MKKGKRSKCFLSKIKLQLKPNCNRKQYVCHLFRDHQHWQKSFCYTYESLNISNKNIFSDT